MARPSSIGSDTTAGSRGLILALCAFLLVGGGGSAQNAELGITGEPDALALLRQARTQLGPTDRIRAVKGLRVDGVQIRGPQDMDRSRFRYSILFPNAFRSDSDTVTTVLAGQLYWREFHQPVPFLNQSAEEDQQIRQRTLRGFVETCLLVLLRAPEPSVVEAKLAGRKTVGSLTGDVIEFVIKGVGSVEYVFDPKTRQPLGFVRRGRLAGTDQETLRVERFVRYEPVAGIRVPVESEEVFIGTSLSDKPQRLERTISVDPPLGPQDFQRPAKVK